MNRVCRAFLIVLIFISGSAFAHSYQQGDIRIGHIWAEAPPPGTRMLSVYIPLFNSGKDPDIFESASCPLASSVDIHPGSTSDASSVILLPNTPVSLRPGKTELVISGLSRDIKVGEWVPLTMHFEKAGTIHVKIMIEAPKTPVGVP